MRPLLAAVALLCIGVSPTVALAQEGESYSVVRDVDYDRGTPPQFPSEPTHNQLDVYVPTAAAGAPRPVVVWIHGGAWIRGDKGNKMQLKAPLFTNAGYILVSINYRLSPDPPLPVLPTRVRHPDHVHDAGEALAWLQEHVAEYGGDPKRMLLVGHSAGAHLAALAATDPSHITAQDGDPSGIRAVVGLDGAGYDVAADLEGTEGNLLDTEAGPLNKPLFWNAFGNPVEEQLDNRWADASPVTHGDLADPPFLLVTQATDDRRIERNRAMVEAVGQDPDASVLLYGKTHAQFNDHLGDPSDDSGMTEAVMAFLEQHRRVTRRNGSNRGRSDRARPALR